MVLTLKQFFVIMMTMMSGVVDALKEHGYMPGEDILIMSIDGTGEALAGIRNGEVIFVAECTPLLGPNVMRILAQLKTEKKYLFVSFHQKRPLISILLQQLI